MPRITAQELATKLNGRLIGDVKTMLANVAPLEDAGPESVSFLANPRYAAKLADSRAAVVLVAPGVQRENGAVIEVANPYSALADILEFFDPKSAPSPGIHRDASVAEGATVAASAFIGPHCVIGAGAAIGEHAVLHALVHVGENSVVGEFTEIFPHVTLRERVTIGKRVILHSGVVIGADGFGFAPDREGYKKIRQIGTVVIEDDVEIGANSTIDRATLGETRVGAGTKIDNLVQIGHNVRIGKNCVIVAQVGISGSTEIGDDCRIGGQVGFIGHIKVGRGAQIGAQSGVAGDVADGAMISGSPARQHSLWKRVEASLTRLPELLRRVRKLEEKMELNSATSDSRE